MPIFFWLLLVFTMGACVGSFLNVCVYRLPLDKSLLWPGSHCGHCLQPIRWYDNVPLLSYWQRRGRCRACGRRFSSRYFLVELLTALGFVGLFYLEVVANVHRFDPRVLGPFTFESPTFLDDGPTRADVACLTTFAYHAVLCSFLVVATFCDFDRRLIPLSLTMTGTVVGLAGALLFAWPWPYTPAEALPRVAWSFPRPPEQGGFQQGLYPWPFWGVTQGALRPGTLPAWFHPGGNWQTGLANGLLGALVGTLMLRGVRFCFGLGMGADYMEDADPDDPGGLWSWLGRVGGKTLGLGDADLMMMAGAFLGWQPIAVAFFVAVIPGLFFGLGQLVLRGNHALPFGPALAIGILLTLLFWTWIGPPFQAVFFFDVLLWILIASSCLFMLIAGYVLRLIRLMRG